MIFPLAAVTTTLLVGAGVASATRVSTEELQNKLRLAPNVASRLKILDQDDDFVFDFLNPPGGSGETFGKGGHTVGATGANFPALIGSGMAMTVGFLGPCGMNTPHTHPRATEFNILVAGSYLRSGIIHENGGRFIVGDIPLGSGSIFQQGAIHFEQNLGCDPAIFVAAFNNEDPGVSQIAQRFFDIEKDAIAAVLGGIDVQEFAHLELPANIALGTEECLKRCHIDPATFSYNASSPFDWNVAANLKTVGDGKGAGSGKKTSGPASANPGTGSFAANSLLSDGEAPVASAVPFMENPLHGAVIGLGVTAGVLLIALIAAVSRIFMAPKRVVYDSLDVGREKSGDQRPFLDAPRSSISKSHSRSPSRTELPYSERG